MSSLRERVKTLSGNKRRFILLRIADMDTKAALKLIGVVKGTYNSWCQNSEFVEIHREVSALKQEYKQEAVQLLRRDNQLDAVLLESRIISEMKAEIESKEYNLIRTNLAKEVYSRLLNDLDYQPPSLSLSWEQKVQLIKEGKWTPQITEGGEVIDGEIISETTGSEETEHQESISVSDSEQEDIPNQEEA